VNDRERFLDRWSRRKRAGPGDAEAPAAEAPAEVPEETTPEEPDQRSDEEILAELGLPDPDALQPGDGVQGFMQSTVPGRLRRRALRAYWRASAGLNLPDGLVEYGEDYTDAASVVENLQSLYQVGRGMVRDEPDEPEPATTTDPPTDGAAALEEATAADETNERTTAAEPVEETVEPASDPEAPGSEQDFIAVTRRRMAFHFED